MVGYLLIGNPLAKDFGIGIKHHIPFFHQLTTFVGVIILKKHEQQQIIYVIISFLALVGYYFVFSTDNWIYIGITVMVALVLYSIICWMWCKKHLK